MRFTYQPMTAEALKRGLDAAGISGGQFADAFSVPYADEVPLWLSARKEVPRWVPAALTLLAVRGASTAADERRPLKEVLHALGMDTWALARLIGANGQTVQRWRSGQNDQPFYLPRFLALLQLPGALSLAREVAARFIVEVRDRPELGDKPFLAARQRRAV